MHLITKSLFTSANLIQQLVTTLNYVFCARIIPHDKMAVSEKKKNSQHRPIAEPEQPLETLKIKLFLLFNLLPDLPT